jgi:hypothetical protein
MGARNIRNGISSMPAGADYKEVKITSWPDRGHNSATVTSGPPTATTDPPTSAPVPPQPSKAPSFISNAGVLNSLAELANIYDPAQWDIAVDDPSGARRWTDITDSTPPSANFGGGITLRIGRPEFARFDKPGRRAWQLLDLFTTGPRVNTEGLLNINTASREALRALGAQVLLDRDQDKLPTGQLYPPSASRLADQFADAVIAGRPFLSPAQLSGMRIANASASFFGNTTTWTSNAPTQWNDSGTEEYFAKVFPLSTVRSRNFRVFVTGQALDKNNNVLSTVSKVFQVHLKPTRDATGKITSQQVVTSYEAQLPL